MAEDNGDKTEAPTPRRRQEAREQGNIARSPDLTAAVLLLAVMQMLKWFGPGLMESLKALMVEMLSAGSMSSLATGDLGVGLVRATVQAGKAILPLFIGLMITAFLVNVMQVGLFFSTKRLQPNLAALNPMKGISKLFKGGDGFMKLVMGLAKLALVTLVAYSAVHGHLPQIILAQRLSFVQIFGLGGDIIYSIGMRIGVVLLVLALADYIWQRFKIEKQLKMSKQEVKEEMKRMEGDPHIKQRRRQIQIQVATQRLKVAVPTADVVVTNPTEFAIALKYDAATMHAPKVVAKGRGFMAARIREMAIAHGVPILERKPLARALFKLVEVGGEVPEQFYSAVAEILAYVYELNGTLKQRRSA